jgi:putative heme-binding domain-containing protein
MTRTTMPDDTAPLIRVVAVAAVTTTIVLATVLVQFVRSGGAGTRMAAPTAAPPNEIGELAAGLTAPGAAPIVPGIRLPRWIWAAGDIGPDDAVSFTRSVAIPDDADQVHLLLSCDNEAVVRVDGLEIATSTDWATPLSLDLGDHLDPGTRQFTLEVAARNQGGPAGLLATIEFHTGDPRRDRIVSDASWRVTAAAGAPADAPAFEIAEGGEAPWGDVPGFDRPPLDRQLQVPEGFIVELVYDVPASQGSWVSLAVDGRGRLLASDQAGGLFRVTPAPLGSPAGETRVEAIDLPVGAAQGLLYVGDDLFCVTAGQRADGPGLYRIRDVDGDDAFDEWQRLIVLNEGGEHGPHGIVPGPDGTLYLVAGNHTHLPELDRSLVPECWGEDHLLPRMWDARGHAVGILAPGGWICRLNPDGTEVELFAAGFRNSYDLAFDRHGELFTYDSDMEWDLGAPWYRPTRIVHAVSGADYGWRSGSGKWPVHYADSLPGTLDIGPGSPTGLTFGYETNFPAPYRDALFALDWTFGTVYAVHLEPDGASYAATHEPFLTGRPLPVADIVAHPGDGALYVVVGGRRIRSAIYRVRPEVPAPARGSAAPATAPRPLPTAHATRRALEALHGGGASTDALDTIWPALGDPDRFVAHAARVALEFQPVDAWFSRLPSETDDSIRLQALIALARRGDPGMQAAAVDMLAAMPYPALTLDQRRTWLRAASLCFIRLGPPDEAQAARLRSLLEPHYPDPGGDAMTTRELCSMLVALDSPVVVSRTLTLLDEADDDSVAPDAWFDRTLLSRNDSYGSVILKAAAAMPQQQQMALALSLRRATAGWTPPLRQRYFEWFASARRTSGGLSFSGFLDQIRRDALTVIPEAERATWEPVGTADAAAALDPDRPFAAGPGRRWTVDELAALAPNRLTGRDFENGRDMFTAAMCAQCHRVAGIGGDAGPDLTAVRTRFAMRDLLESIIEPSRAISSQYEQTEFLLDDDTLVTGRVVDLDEDTLRVQPSSLAPDYLVTVDRRRIVSQRASPVSPMMPHLLDALNQDEVMDLIAYLLAEGDARNPMFSGSR